MRIHFVIALVFVDFVVNPGHLQNKLLLDYTKIMIMSINKNDDPLAKLAFLPPKTHFYLYSKALFIHRDMKKKWATAWTSVVIFNLITNLWYSWGAAICLFAHTFAEINISNQSKCLGWFEKITQKTYTLWKKKQRFCTYFVD